MNIDDNMLKTHDIKIIHQGEEFVVDHIKGNWGVCGYKGKIKGNLDLRVAVEFGMEDSYCMLYVTTPKINPVYQHGDEYKEVDCFWDYAEHLFVLFINPTWTYNAKVNDYLTIKNNTIYIDLDQVERDTQDIKI